MSGDGRRARRELLDALLAERHTPVPPPPTPDGQQPVSPQQGQRNLRRLGDATGRRRRR